MAKKGNRQVVGFECSECKNKNYVSEKNVINSKDKVSLSKYCKHCHKHTPHGEGKIR